MNVLKIIVACVCFSMCDANAITYETFEKLLNSFACQVDDACPVVYSEHLKLTKFYCDMADAKAILQENKNGITDRLAKSIEGNANKLLDGVMFEKFGKYQLQSIIEAIRSFQSASVGNWDANALQDKHSDLYEVLIKAISLDEQ
ncbi:hypothetical protein FACS189449_00520 [Alphaproteobacteria bacterium]|nr:hypothetical protein FACS189449_00520 [Alphaproteobacteria bacterium]